MLYSLNMYFKLKIFRLLSNFHYKIKDNCIIKMDSFIHFKCYAQFFNFLIMSIFYIFSVSDTIKNNTTFL